MEPAHSLRVVARPATEQFSRLNYKERRLGQDRVFRVNRAKNAASQAVFAIRAIPSLEAQRSRFTYGTLFLAASIAFMPE